MKILFISFYFPPIKAVASIRTWNICQGLLAAGHQVQVVTVDEQCFAKEQLEAVSDMNEVTAYQAFSKIRISSIWPALYGGRSAIAHGRIRQWLMWQLTRIAFKFTVWSGFDPVIFWAFTAWWRLRVITDIDLVLVSGGPFSTFLPATFLARRLKCPLVLDYRDVWNNAPHVNFRLSWMRLERWWLRQANLVTSVSPSCLASILDVSQRPGVVITNGVSEYVYQYRKYHLQPPTSIIVYAGAFYPPTRSVDPFFAALAMAREHHVELQGIRFVYIGPSTDYVKQAAQAHGVDSLLDCRGVVSHDEALKLQAQSLCTLVVTTVKDLADGADRGILTGKLFEAIELARNVLVISPTNSDARELTANIPHVQHFTGTQLKAMADWLEVLHYSPQGDSLSQSQYFSWTKLSAKYAQQVDLWRGIC